MRHSRAQEWVRALNRCLLPDCRQSIRGFRVCYLTDSQNARLEGLPTFPPLIAGPEESLREVLGTLGAAPLDTLVAFHALCCAVVARAYVDVWDLGADAQVGWLFAHQIALVKDRNGDGFAVLMSFVLVNGTHVTQSDCSLLRCSV